MSGEATLWDRLRNNIGHVGHFSRLEFNPTPGIPDACYCIKGVEGFIELKHAAEAPKRETSKVKWGHPLDDAQIAWIYTRVKHGGRVFILAQVGLLMFLIPGGYFRSFNAMTLHQLYKASVWCNDPPGTDWLGLVEQLKRYDKWKVI